MPDLPFNTDLQGDIVKAAAVLRDFITPGKGEGLDKIIPSNLLDNALGIAVLTVLKAGLFWSGRFGSGLVVARLPDGTWSAPSAIGIAGTGVGWQIGAGLTEYVLILNTQDAVNGFTRTGHLTLGGALSVAAGPMGRTAEASASIQNSFAPVYSYSRTKGLFIGASLEGTLLIERTDANYEFYQNAHRASELLTGKVPPPPEGEPLYSALQQCGVGRMLGSHANVTQDETENSEVQISIPKESEAA